MKRILDGLMSTLLDTEIDYRVENVRLKVKNNAKTFVRHVRRVYFLGFIVQYTRDPSGEIITIIVPGGQMMELKESYWAEVQIGRIEGTLRSKTVGYQEWSDTWI